MTRRPPALAVLAAGLSLGLLAVACSGGGSNRRFIPVPPPTVAKITTAPPGTDFSGVSLAPVEGREPAPVVEITGGMATLGGIVTGPDGPVGGATVRLERFVGDASAKLDITTNPDGSWKAPQTAPPPLPTIPTTASTFPGQITIPPITTVPPPTVATTPPLGPEGLQGGRYRVRAWRTPDLALTTPQILFLDAKQNQTVGMALSRYQGVSASSIVSPDPPVLNATTNVTVVVSTASVSPEGIVSGVPLPNAAVSLAVGPGWIFSSGPGITNAQGRATFQLRCAALGQSPLEVTVNGTQTFSLPVKACVAPPSTTTTSLPDESIPSSSSIPGGGGSSTTRNTPSTT
jgi:hypothetical protein